MNEFGSRVRVLCRPPVLILCALTLAGAHCTSAAAQRIGTAELLSSKWSGEVAANSLFTPGSDAVAEHAPFLGTLRLTETEMTTKPAVFSPPSVLGRDPHLFPGVAISFFTYKDDLVPFTQDVIRYASNDQGRSYWDVIVQPGRVWSQPDDSGWSRAGFPFALVNSIEGETHNGLATFLYKDGRVSNLRFQIVQQTAPFYIKDDFVAAGLVPATFAPVATDQLSSLKRGYEADRADGVPIASWDELAAKVGGAKLANFDGPMRASDIVLSGLDYQGTFYLKGCQSAGGQLPWCDRARFGVWSATKALANETALLRLAEKYGPTVFEMRIADYVPEAARYRGWRNVRFEDAINMTTGIGNGSTKREPNDTSDGYLDTSYSRWYEARSTQEKVAALLKDGRVYPWGPARSRATAIRICSFSESRWTAFSNRRRDHGQHLVDVAARSVCANRYSSCTDQPHYRSGWQRRATTHGLRLLSNHQRYRLDSAALPKRRQARRPADLVRAAHTRVASRPKSAGISNWREAAGG